MKFFQRRAAPKMKTPPPGGQRISRRGERGGPYFDAGGRPTGYSFIACRSQSTKLAHSQRSSVPGFQHRK